MGDCQNKQRRVCALVPRTVAREITERECSTHDRQVCENIPKQVCSDVNSPRQVCNQVPDEVCENKFASITKYMMRRSAPAPSAGSVSPPPGRSARTWWSRCPGRPTSRSATPGMSSSVALLTSLSPEPATKLSAELSTLKNVRLQEVVMELRLVVVYHRDTQ